jgi:hypothetical protein
MSLSFPTTHSNKSQNADVCRVSRCVSAALCTSWVADNLAGLFPNNPAKHNSQSRQDVPSKGGDEHPKSNCHNVNHEITCSFLNMVNLARSVIGISNGGIS